jgi:hypothetical protein
VTAVEAVFTRMSGSRMVGLFLLFVALSLAGCTEPGGERSASNEHAPMAIQSSEPSAAAPTPTFAPADNARRTAEERRTRLGVRFSVYKCCVQLHETGDYDAAVAALRDELEDYPLVTEATIENSYVCIVTRGGQLLEFNLIPTAPPGPLMF